MQITFPQSHVALICGGTAPIGMQIAARLAQAGCGNIVLSGRDEARGSRAVTQLQQLSPNTSFRFIRTDISEAASTRAMFEFVATQYGALDTYFHCVPPGGASGPLSTADRERFRMSLNVGLGALADACYGAAEALKRRGGGSLLLFASDAGRAAAPGHSLIGTVQSGVIALARSLALELSKDQIRVNCISPTYVLGTPLVDRLMQSPVSSRTIEKAANRASLGLPHPEDIAPLAVFLASALAAKITGQVVSVNGGLSAN